MSIFTSLITAVLVGSTSVMPAAPAVTFELELNEHEIIEHTLESEFRKKLAEMRASSRHAAIQTVDGGTFSYIPVPAEIIPEEKIFFPVKDAETSSQYGPRPKLCDGCSTFHNGVDFTPGYGEPVYSIADGQVVDVGFNSTGYGRYIYIEHTIDGEKYMSVYAHLEQWTMLVEEGDSVFAGEEIGSVGNTGISTGPHLHFEVRDSEDEFLDPMVFLEEQEAEQLP